MLKFSAGVYKDQIDQIQTFAPNYDSKTGVKGNGYRSFIRIAANFVPVVTAKVTSIKKKGLKNANGTDIQDLENLTECLDKLVELTGFIIEIHNLHSEDILFPRQPDISDQAVEDMSLRIALSDFSIFYGPVCGFHYGSDFRRFAKPLATFMATFADVYEEDGYSAKLRKLAHSLFGARYVVDSKLLTSRLARTIRDKPVEFTKTFFNLSEMEFLHRNQFSVKSQRDGIKANCVLEIPLERMKIINTQGVDANEGSFNQVRI